MGGNGFISSDAGLDSMENVNGKNEVRVLALLNERRQKKKDVKALGQNLYDTATVICSFSKHVPRPSSIFTTPNEPRAPREVATQELPFVKSGDYFKSSNAASAEHLNGHAVSPHVKETPKQSGMQHSQGERMTSRPSKSKQPGLEAPKNDQCMSKVRNHLTENANGRRLSFQSLDPLSFDGTMENRKSTEKNMPSKPIYNNMADNQVGALASPAMKLDASVQRVVPNLPTLRVASRLNCETMEQMKDEVIHHRHDQSPDFFFSIDYDSSSNFRPTTAFVNRSLFFALSDPETLIQSFREIDNQAYKHSPLPHLDSTRLAHVFRDWNRRNGSLVFDSLWIAVKALFIPPPELDVQKCSRLKPARRTSADVISEPNPRQDDSQTPAARYLSNEDAAHIIMICIHALTSLVPVGWAHTWVQLRDLRSWGITIPDAPAKADPTDGFADPWLEIVDGLEYEPALRLADRLIRGIGARLCFEHIISTLKPKDNPSNHSNYDRPEFNLIHILMRHLEEAERLALANKKKLMTNQNYLKDPGWTVTSTFMEWLRTIIIKKWDGKAVVNKWDNVGVAVLLFDMFRKLRWT
jgi:hypothetical protein